METKRKGISIESCHGEVSIEFHVLSHGFTNDEKSKYITTIIGPDESVARIIIDSRSNRDSYAHKLSSAICLALKNDCWWPDIVLARKEAEDQRRETPLDERATAELWAKSEPRYYVSLIAPEYEGYKNVPFCLFHETNLRADELALLIVLAPGRTINDLLGSYAGTYIEQTFSKAEVKQLYGYLKVKNSYPGRFEVRTAGPPDNHCMGVAAIPVGGWNGFYMFSREPGYSLPFKVWGYFDLKRRERVRQAPNKDERV